jgi:hypothetical protein
MMFSVPVGYEQAIIFTLYSDVVISKRPKVRQAREKSSVQEMSDSYKSLP